jgi:tryptophan-rich sensory protein
MREPHLHPALSLRGLVTLCLAIIPVMLASLIGQFFTAPAINGWYATLQKPFFNPPNVVFPLVWTFLYALMAVAFWRILRARPEAGPVGGAIAVFLAQLVANAGWSYAFFGLRSPLAGLLVIGVMLVLIALTIRRFVPIDRAAGYALFPYLAWVGFAAILNAAIVILNP